MKNFELMASSNSLTGIEIAIREFYCGSIKRLVPLEPGVWRVVNPDGTPLAWDMRVMHRSGRYYFGHQQVSNG